MKVTSISDELDLRIHQIAEFMVRTECTIRQASKVSCVNKSTIHRDIHTRLPKVDSDLYIRVCKLLSYNKSVGHIRGGLATKERYLTNKNN